MNMDVIERCIVCDVSTGSAEKCAVCTEFGDDSPYCGGCVRPCPECKEMVCYDHAGARTGRCDSCIRRDDALTGDPR